MSDIVERLRDYSRHDTDEMLDEAADLIEQQAARIAELEAIVDILKIAAESDAVLLRDTENRLADLRAKIDNADIIGWIDARGKIIKRTEEGNAVTVTTPTRTLICREDLK